MKCVMRLEREKPSTAVDFLPFRPLNTSECAARLLRFGSCFSTVDSSSPRNKQPTVCASGPAAAPHRHAVTRRHSVRTLRRSVSGGLLARRLLRDTRGLSANDALCVKTCSAGAPAVSASECSFMRWGQVSRYSAKTTGW